MNVARHWHRNMRSCRRHRKATILAAWIETWSMILPLDIRRIAFVDAGSSSTCGGRPLQSIWPSDTLAGGVDKRAGAASRSQTGGHHVEIANLDAQCPWADEVERRLRAVPPASISMTADTLPTTMRRDGLTRIRASFRPPDGGASRYGEKARARKPT